MKNYLIELRDENGNPVFVSALHVAGIENSQNYGSIIYFGLTSFTVRESVEEVYRAIENVLKN